MSTQQQPTPQQQISNYPLFNINNNNNNDIMILGSNPQEDDHHQHHHARPDLENNNDDDDDDDNNNDNDYSPYESSHQLLSLLPPGTSLSPANRPSPTTSATTAFHTTSSTSTVRRICSYFYLRFCQPVVRTMRCCCCCCCPTKRSSSNIAGSSSSSCTMQCVATAVLWGTITALLFAIVWYSYELFNHGTDPHLIAWFSAGAFVLLGFPVSMYGIISHLTNYNAPHIQVYIVRILWMVPIYSIESWLAMRFHKQAVFIETARDVYESFVLYCFLQFLIQVLGGEQALILMLKDKSPTRGVHMCYGFDKILGLKPWLMGQPIRRSIYVPKSSTTGSKDFDDSVNTKTDTIQNDDDDHIDDDDHHHIDHNDTNQLLSHRATVVERVTAALSPTPRPNPRFVQLGQQPHNYNPSPKNVAITTTTLSGIAPTTLSTMPSSSSNSTHFRVYWTSPFFIQCKFGVLQYVLMKLFCAVAVLILEYYGWYKEGQFHFNAGYLYICILTNVSQCYALYCLIFFYFATKNELSPIRPVGKFLSVKALVFFTWWQSVLISVLYQMDMIPNYRASNTEKNWNPEDVAKGIQDYCICIEMFVAAIVHSVVFPHSEYSVAAVRAREQAMGIGQGQNDQYPYNKTLDESGRMIYYNTKKRLGRRAGRQQQQHRWKARNEASSSLFHDTSNTSTLHDGAKADLELVPMSMDGMQTNINKVDSHDAQSDDNSYGTWGSKESNQYTSKNYPIRPPPLYSPEDGSNVAARSSNSVPTSIIAPTIQPGNSIATNCDILGQKKPGLFRAFIDTAIPRDLHDNTVNMLLQRGEYTSSQKTTLLHHAATSDQYDLFAKNNQYNKQRSSNRQQQNYKDSVTTSSTGTTPPSPSLPRNSSQVKSDY